MVATNQLNLNGHSFISSRCAAAPRCAPHRYAFRLGLTRCFSIQLNDLFVTTLRSVPPLRATRHASAHGIFLRRGAAPLNATICLLLRNELRTTTPRFATPLRTPLHFSTLCAAPQFNATICLLIYNAAAPYNSA